eukprot:XP_011660675.1 PREDICTED: tethering factor for nuclear proteasome STS1 isoform X3 [Strongylocentrotus purpuratus]
MFPGRLNNNSRPEVLRELPVSSIDSNANIGRTTRSGNSIVITMSPERPPRIPITAMGGEGPFCSPVQYLYATGRTRRRLQLYPDLDRPVSPTFDDFKPQLASTPGPSSPCRSSPRSSPRKRNITQTSDYYSHLGSAEESILQESVSWLRRAKKARKERRESALDLVKRLRALSVDQLATVIGDLIKQHPDLEEDLQDLVPEPDISSCEEEVCELLHNIYRAMPRSRLSSSRGAYSYRQVRLHIIKFKKECIQHGRHFVKCKAWDAAIRYVLVAWQQVHKLPVWECPAHNRLRTTSYLGLAGVCVEALRKGAFSLQTLQEFRPKIEAMVSSAPEMAACLQRLDIMTETTSEA